jgi:membrane-bound serine protease (ClpP class)
VNLAMLAEITTGNQAELLIGAIALLLLSFVLVSLELVIPSHGVLTIFAGLAAMASVVLAYLVRPELAVLFGVVLLLATPVVFYFAIKVYPNTTVGKKVLLNKPSSTMAGFEQEMARLELLVGRQGVAASFLRPAGIVELDGQRVDAVAESDMIPAGTTVEVIQVSGLKVIVKAVG